jgi:hypothetical protein
VGCYSRAGLAFFVVEGVVTSANPIRDERGRPLFICRVCAAPLTFDDLVAQKLRPPDRGESASDYLDAELLDGIDHAVCVRSRTRAG